MPTTVSSASCGGVGVTQYSAAGTSANKAFQNA
jgi:hypothetical protein